MILRSAQFLRSDAAQSQDRAPPLSTVKRWLNHTCELVAFLVHFDFLVAEEGREN
jgi:hypothetical protein